MPVSGVRTKALLARLPVLQPKLKSLDLHALSTPPTFTLDQDQILNKTHENNEKLSNMVHDYCNLIVIC